RAIVIFVAMGQHDAGEATPLLLNEADVRQDEIDARQLCASEGHAAIDQQPAAVLRRPQSIEGEVHANLAHPAERHEDELALILPAVRHRPAVAATPKCTSPAAIAWTCPSRPRIRRRPSASMSSNTPERTRPPIST